MANKDAMLAKMVVFLRTHMMLNLVFENSVTSPHLQITLQK